MQAAGGLAVVPMVDSGWFDCGTPERLVAWLSNTADPGGILRRLRQAPVIRPGLGQRRGHRGGVIARPTTRSGDRRAG